MIKLLTAPPVPVWDNAGSKPVLQKGSSAKSKEAQHRRVKKKAIRLPSKLVPSGSHLKSTKDGKPSSASTLEYKQVGSSSKPRTSTAEINMNNAMTLHDKSKAQNLLDVDDIAPTGGERDLEEIEDHLRNTLSNSEEALNSIESSSPRKKRFVSTKR